jgi:hypothetical protein
MRTLIAIGLAVLFVVSVSFLLRARSKKQAQTRPDVYDGLRAQVLKGTRSSFDLAPTSAPMVPWGVVMDWGVSEGSATVVALSDGHASIYLSSGGGYLGGSQSHESIRSAAQTAVATAEEFQPQMRSTNTFPLPHRGEVIFYLLTDAGVFTASGSQQEMSSQHNKLSRLGNAMQLIITEYQKIQ